MRVNKFKSGAVPLETIKKTMGYLTPQETNKEKVRIGQAYDGGYVLLDLFNTSGDGIVYSFGVGSKHDFEIDMASRGYTSYMYDHTVKGLRVQNMNRLKFFRTGIGKTDTDPFKTIPTLLKENGHLNRNDIILQCDIEGSEWDVFSGVEQKYLNCFSQICVELHWIEEYILGKIAKEGANLVSYQFDKITATLEKLTQNFTVFHIHGNNYRNALEIDGVVVPSVIEISMIRNDLVELSEGTTTYPTSLDTPNRKGAPDFKLGKFAWN